MLPDFFVSYAPNAAHLTAAQKFQLGWKTIIDPVSLLGTSISAGIEQARNNHPEFGQGTEGYAKRFGAQYANQVSRVIIGRVVMQSIFHQDPRYFYKGTGSIRSRALYAIGTAFLAKGDNGNWQFDYSDVLGGMASHELSTLYYPSTSRPVRKLADDVLLGFAGRAENNLLHEFVLRRFTTHVPKIAAGLSQRILPEGTPVSLISVEDWTSKTAESGGPIAFMLAGDIQVDGVIIAPIGSKAWGHASFAGGDGQAMQVGLDQCAPQGWRYGCAAQKHAATRWWRRIGVSSPRKLRQDRHSAVRSRECYVTSEGTMSDGPFVRAAGYQIQTTSSRFCSTLSASEAEAIFSSPRQVGDGREHRS